MKDICVHIVICLVIGLAGCSILHQKENSQRSLRTSFTEDMGLWLLQRESSANVAVEIDAYVLIALSRLHFSDPSHNDLLLPNALPRVSRLYSVISRVKEDPIRSREEESLAGYALVEFMWGFGDCEADWPFRKETVLSLVKEICLRGPRQNGRLRFVIPLCLARLYQLEPDELYVHEITARRECVEVMLQTDPTLQLRLLDAWFSVYLDEELSKDISMWLRNGRLRDLVSCGNDKWYVMLLVRDMLCSYHLDDRNARRAWYKHLAEDTVPPSDWVPGMNVALDLGDNLAERQVLTYCYVLLSWLSSR